MPLGVLIMLLIFIPFIAMIIMFVSTTNLNDPNNKPISFLPENNQFVMNTIVLCLLYAAFNFFMWLPHDGSPEIIDGKYVLSRKGKILAEITEEEYGKRKVLDVRLFSGHWLIFAIVPMFHFYGNLAQKNNHINNHANN
ncbi:MAG: hypothetical protein LBU34_00250 [Planctomycetaceae bacterium]|nr:hypothetical protein [Planctomycetaceae bacterium]